MITLTLEQRYQVICIYLTDTVIIKKIHDLLKIDIGPKDLHLKISANVGNDRSLNSRPDHAS